MKSLDNTRVSGEVWKLLGKGNKMPIASDAFDLIATVMSGASVIVAVGLVITIALVGRDRRRAPSIRLGGAGDGLPLGGAAQCPAKTTKERLRELDELQQRHVISAEEYVRAREKVLSGG